MIGTTLGHYRIVDLLGRGGMGEVYLAEDSRLQRRVALKILARELAGDPDRRERFEREARAAAALNHPNIVTIHSVEEVDGTPFLTLELIEGQTLADLIPEDGLSLDRVLALAIPLADAVGAAHQRGITHRDLKPANVMVTGDGRVKVLDFGLAKLKEDARLAAEAGMPTGVLTGDGRIVGTVAYMSPEQAEGKAVDQRSDVFSLGVILYEMATGVRPFTGDTQMSVLSAIMKDSPRPLTGGGRALPRQFSRIVLRCLSKDAEDRYQTAKDLRNDLRVLRNDLTSGEVVPVSQSGTQAVPRGGTSRGRLAAGLAILVLLAGAGGAFLFRSRPAASAAPATRPFDAIGLTRLTTTGTAGLASISADGRYVAHVSARGGQQSLWLRQIATTSNVEIVPPAEVRYAGVTFSPDGNHIYYTTYAAGGNLANLYQIPVLGGGARLVIEDIDTAAAFSPDGSQVAFIRGFPSDGASAVMLAQADGSGQRPLATRKRPAEFPLAGLAWSPDGRTIVATGANEERLRGEIVAIDVASGSERILPTPDWRQITRLAWLPDGSGLLVNAQESAGESSSQIFFVGYPSGETRRITSDLSNYTGLSLAPDGHSFVCIRNELRASIWLQPIGDPSKAAAITTDAGTDDGIHGISWAPDGRIVYTTEAGGNPDVWIMAPDGTRRVQLTSTAGQDISPRVTPDGRYIVFASDRDGAMRLWRMGLDGSGPTRLSPDVVARGRGTVSADSQWVYYSDSAGESRKVSVAGGAPAPAFDGGPPAALPPGFHEPMPAPDGTLLAGHYSEQAARSERIAIVPTAGGPARLLTTVPPPATWAPDGRGLVYVDTRAGVSNLLRQPVTGGPATPLTKFTAEQIFTYAISPDQRHLGLVRGRVSSDVVLIADRTAAARPAATRD
ncbi:MAG TPA: protein kinase [Vicinamibacterales bacterium]|nr:protein kinase [Vicinamibacterales bacterium]